MDGTDLGSESLAEELIGLIKDEHLDVAGAEVSSLDHVEHATGGSRDDVLSMVELADVLANRGSSNAGVARRVHVVCTYSVSSLIMYETQLHLSGPMDLRVEAKRKVGTHLQGRARHSGSESPAHG